MIGFCEFRIETNGGVIVSNRLPVVSSEKKGIAAVKMGP